MVKQDFLVDFHCHASLRAMNSNPAKKRNIWHKTFNAEINSPIGRWARFQTREIAKESQTNFLDYSQSNTRVIFDSLYPVEKGWHNFRKIPSFLVSEKARDELMLVSTGIDYDRMCHLRKNTCYFDELQEMYQFLKDGQGLCPESKNRYKIVKDFRQLNQVLRHHPDCLAVILTIEGGHALECGLPNTSSLSLKSHKSLIEENINTIKNWEHPVFFLNLAHHFYNQLCGHARSLKSPINIMFNQGVQLNEGITKLGWFALEKLLDTHNGKRILIDVKHMSLNSRKEFYKYIQNHNKKNPKDKIPVICSHGGVSGYESLADAMKRPDVMKKHKGSYFNNWSINLSDEDIKVIHESGGMIGIMMDKSLLGSSFTLKEIKALPTLQMRTEALLKLFMDNVFHIIKVIGQSDAWDIVTVGTDYDGMITHIDSYPNAASLHRFKSDLIGFLRVNQYKKELWYKFSEADLMDKIFNQNAINFLRKHFN